LKYEYENKFGGERREILIGDPKDYNKLGHHIANGRVLVSDSLEAPFTIH
jgi:hypothetical protein